MIRSNRFMKILVGLLVLIQLFAFQSSTSPENWIEYPENEKFNSEWKKVADFEKKGLPKSAIEVVEQIYSEAKRTDNHEQVAKALIYRSKYIAQTEEEAVSKILQQFNDEVATAKFPLKQVLHSYLASYYWGYYSKKQWVINQRTVIPGLQSKDISDWDKMDFVSKMKEHLNLSLENADSLQRVKTEVFEEIINRGTQALSLRPSLYDFLAHRAIQYLETSSNENSLLSDDSFLANDDFFSSANKFSKLKIEVLDSSSNPYQTIRLFQEILSFRLKSKNTEALIDADLARLDHLNQHSKSDTKDSLYLNALGQIQEKYSENQQVGEVVFLIANYYSDRSHNYKFNQEETHRYKGFAKTAEDLYLSIIEKYNGTSAVEKAEYRLELLRKQELRMEMKTGLIPENNFPLRLEYKNINKLYVRFLKVDTTEYFEYLTNNRGRNGLDKLINKSKLVRESEHVIEGFDDLNSHSQMLVQKGLPIGKYILIVSDNEKFNLEHGLYSLKFFDVSNMAYMSRNDRYAGKTDLVIVDRDNGNPLVGVEVDRYSERYSRGIQKNEIVKLERVKSDENGFVKLPPNEGYRSNYHTVFRKGNDYLIVDERFYYYGNREENDPVICSFFTDRKIYRPGQIVYFKGILHKGKGNASKVEPNKKVNVQLLDANWQSIKEMELVSNEFGSFSGSFTLPKSALTGSFRIETEFGSHEFRVEEYKRPKMKVEFLPIEGQCRYNDMVTVKGTVKSYTGHPVSFADIQYAVNRSSHRPYDSYFRAWLPPNRQIDFGRAKTNEKGEFEIQFTALAPKGKKNIPWLNFEVEVDATDQNGETQSASKTVQLADHTIYIDSNFPVKLDLQKKEQQFDIAVKTVNEQALEQKVDIEVFQLEAPALLYENKLSKAEKYFRTKAQWKEELPDIAYKDEFDKENYPVKKQVAKFSINTNDDQKLAISILGNRLPGVYKIVMSTSDKFGKKVEKTVYSEFYDSGSKKLHTPKTDWFVDLNDQIEPGETAQFLIGTGIDKVKVLYEILDQDKKLSHEWITLKKGQRIIEIPIEEKHRGGIYVAFTFVHNNRIFKHPSRIDVPFSNKELDISFETFRDELQPGEKEEWRIKIEGAKGDKVAAELLCGMYDASLDKFAANRWSSFFRTPWIHLSPFSSSTFNAEHAQFFHRDFKYPQSPLELYYDQMLWFGVGEYNRMNVFYAGAEQKGGVIARVHGDKGISLNGAITDERMMEMDVQPSFSAELDMIEVPDSEIELVPESVLEGVQTRTNFNETAFFYPHLQTDKEGNVIVAFQVPESLTQWNINGIAQTKDLSIGLFKKELITKKELMAEANPPRFFREGDRIVFPVKISNMSEEDLSGQVTLEFVDALTNGKISLSKEDEQKSFTVVKNGNRILTWELNIPENIHAISYTVKASTGTFTDGEAKTLPVLSNRMLVTESLPMSVRKARDTSFEFSKLKENKSSTLKHHKYTLEFTQNPAWYAVQALPYLMEYPHECAEQLFSRYYANSLAGHIVNSMPEIKRVFDQWKISDNKETFMSNLEKNEDLKNIILNETPWVRDALNEKQQKENIALLFDLNKMQDELALAWQKLEKMQAANGAWPWFPGLHENRYITQHIVAGMGHLQQLGVIDINSNPSQYEAIRQAVRYLDGEMHRDFTRLKIKKELSSLLVHYLYTRSFFADIPMSELHTVAYDHYVNKAEKKWLDFNKYEQAMIAIALHRLEDRETPQAIIKSLKEFSLSSEEFGMYWKSGNGWSWNQAPIEQQALMIELFEEVAKDQQAVNELKVWLLKQKQTQAWKTTKATANAVYALLLSGDNWLDSKESLTIKVGNKVIDPLIDEDISMEAGTGYFKKTWDGSTITPEMGNITVSKSSDRLSWGAIYWQYFEDLDKITSHNTGLSMQKQLYIERREGEKTELDLVTETSLPKIGDKLIVRLHLKSDRNLEFVHMKDMRASGLEPVNFLSGHRYKAGMFYYESIRDASVNFFFDYLPKGDYVFEYPLRVAHRGDFSNGITTIQCMYAPEFSAHSEGVELTVE